MLRLWSRSGVLARPSLFLQTRLAATSTEVAKSGGMKEFLADKTGVTGFGTLVAGLTAVSISKEIIIFHNETLIGFALATVIYGLMKKLGSPIGEYLDQRSQDILDSLNIERNSKLKTLESSILANQQLEENLQCRKDVFEIMQENNALSLEEEYRQRQLTLYNAVKKRLDFQADYEATERRLNHEHLVAWVEQQVAAAVSAKPDESFPRCLQEVERLAAQT